MAIKIDELEDKLSKIRETIRERLGREFVVLIYKSNGDGIIEEDVQILKYFLEHIPAKNLTIVLHGEGEDFVSAVYMTHVLSEDLSTYNAYVPLQCSSALCCLFLKANKLIRAKDCLITQVDPIIQVDGRWFRAIKNMHSENTILQEQARSVLHYARFHVTQLIGTKPSLFKFKDVDYDDFGHTEEIVTQFMNQEQHTSSITIKEMINLDLNVEENDDKELLTNSKQLIELCQEYLKEENKRMMLVSSTSIILNNEEGHLIIPDK